jgi:DNA polymerase
MQLRNAYLAYQAEIGTDEVVLPKPWHPKPKAPVRNSPPPSSQPRRSDTPPPMRKAPATQSHAAMPPETKPALEPVPEFTGFEEYWKYLQDQHARWFPGSAGFARAEGDAHPDLAVVELAPAPSPAPRVFSGEAGALFDRMMKAIQLDRGRLYLTCLMKSPPPGRYWPRKDMARMLPLLIRELRLVRAPMILLLGESCAQAVLRAGSALGAMRKRPFEAEGLMFTASHHPADLENPDPEKTKALKHEAWEDLKWVRDRLALERSA